MTHGRRLSAQGFSLSLGVLFLVWSFVLHAQQLPRQNTSGVNLRMSESLGDVDRSSKTRPQAEKASTAITSGSGSGKNSGPRGVSLELTSGIRFDDNVFRSTFNEKLDVIVEAEPKFYVDGRLGKHSFRLGYEGKVGRYQQYRDESYFDNKILGSVKFNLERRLKASLKTSLEYGHDSRGDLSTRSDTSTAVDRWYQHKLSGEVILGRRIARAQIGLGYHISGIRYMNNEQGLRDFDDRTLRLFGRYNLNPRLALLADISGTWSDYLDPISTQSAREYIGLVGIAWEATVKTSGEIKFGTRHRDFHSEGFPSTTGLTWDAKVYWNPKSYSKVTMYTSRDVNASALQGAGGLTSTDTFGLKWRHSLTQNLRFNAGVEGAQAGISESSTARLFDLEAGINYRMNRWIDLRADWKYSSSSTSDGLSDYEAHSVFFGLDARLNRRIGQN